MKRPVLGVLLQIAVSVGLLALLARRIPVAEVGVALARVRPATVAGSIALALVGYWGRAWRWNALLQRAGVTMPGRTAYCLTLVGICYGIVTPGRVGEFARVLHLSAARAKTLTSVVWDRVGDVLLLEVMALPAFVAIPAWRGPVLWAYLALTAFTLAAIWALDHPAALAALGRLLPRLAPRLERWQAASSGTLTSPAFVSGLLGGLFFYAFVYGSAFLLLRDIAPGVSPLLGLSFPVIPLLGNLPIAFGGLGLREQVSATVFEQFGLAARDGVVFSLLWFVAATLVPGLIGLALAPTRWARSGPARSPATPVARMEIPR
ncbi:MAG: flippase-like domain-containing protein [Candidatus Eisenbacteria bacterium]|nr:flippase-like domain-containing protein [Candidatus Eisenbacteria bacterium]